MPRAKLRTPELRDRLLEAAIETLVDRGVAGFTTRQVAQSAETSIPAVYELFGDRAGLVREIFFESFRRLGTRLAEVPRTADARADLDALVAAFRAYARANPVLIEVMFARPFADFDPGPAEQAAGAAVRTSITDGVGRCIAAGLLDGDSTDLGPIIIALAQGLARQETAGWLGHTEESIDRRWRSAFARLLR